MFLLITRCLGSSFAVFFYIQVKNEITNIKYLYGKDKRKVYHHAKKYLFPLILLSFFLTFSVFLLIFFPLLVPLFLFLLDLAFMLVAA